MGRSQPHRKKCPKQYVTDAELEQMEYARVHKAGSSMYDLSNCDHWNEAYKLRQSSIILKYVVAAAVIVVAAVCLSFVGGVV